MPDDDRPVMSAALLGELAEISSGGNAPQRAEHYGCEGYPFIRAGHLPEILNGRLQIDLPHLHPSVAKSHGLRLFPADTVVFAKSGMSATKGHIYKTTAPCYLVNHLAAIIPGPQLDPRFLRGWLQAHPPARLIRDLGYPSIRLSEVAELQIALPPLPEQKRIASLLDKADALRRKRREAIAKLDTLLQSVFLEMFGDPASNPNGWPVVRLQDLLRFLTSGSRGWAAHYANEGSIFLRIQNVGKGELNLDDVAYVSAPDTAEARRTRVRPGDVLLSITADLGRTGVVPDGIGPAYINQHLALLRLNGVEPVYLSAFIASRAGQMQIQKLNRQGVKAGLNFDDIRSLRVMAPPLPAQRVYGKG